MQWWQQDEAIQPSYRALLWGGWRPTWNGEYLLLQVHLRVWVQASMHRCCSHVSYAVSCTNSTPGWSSVWFLLVPQNELMGTWNLLVSYITCAVVSPSCFHSLMHTCIPHSFVTSCKDHPVHLWDAFYYHRRASYVPHNHLVRTCC